MSAAAAPAGAGAGSTQNFYFNAARLNYWNRDFFNALARHDGDTLWRQVAVFAPLAIMSVGLSVISVWTRMTTQRQWRQWLTSDILGDCFAHDHYRKLEAAPGEYKNAEYRISYDAKSATDSPVDLTLGLVNSVMTAGVFTGVLWSVGGQLTIAVVGGVTYALIFTGIMLVIGRNLPSNRNALTDKRVVRTESKVTGSDSVTLALPPIESLQAGCRVSSDFRFISRRPVAALMIDLAVVVRVTFAL